MMGTEKNLKEQFAYGADIGWLTQMEERGIRWTGPDGNAKDPLLILKDLGVNAVRLRLLWTLHLTDFFISRTERPAF